MVLTGHRLHRLDESAILRWAMEGETGGCSFLSSNQHRTSLGSCRDSMELDCKSKKGVKWRYDPSNGSIIVNHSDAMAQHAM